MSKRVLVIDNDQPFARVIASALQARGLEARICSNGQQGLEEARSEHPDVIVLCVELPKMSGYSVCNKLKKDEQLKSIPLVITSAEATQQTFEQHKRLRTRADEYLLKPFDPGVLLQTIAGLIELPSQVLAAGPTEDEVVIELGDAAPAAELEARPPVHAAGAGLDDVDLKLIDQVFDELALGVSETPGGLNGGAGESAQPVTVVARVQEPAMRGFELDASSPELQALRSRVAELETELARAHLDEEALRQAIDGARAAEERAAAAEGRASEAEQRLRRADALREKARKALGLVLQVLEDAPQRSNPGEVSPRRE